jgi:hypothetical protein
MTIWTYDPISLDPHKDETKRALAMKPGRKSKAHCVRGRDDLGGRLVYGWGETEDEARADAEQQARDWDERGS